MTTALAWVSDGHAVTIAGGKPKDAGMLDVDEFIRCGGDTLYTVSSQDLGTVTPLVSALLAEIAEAARRISQDAPGGRIDPPLTMILDEARLSCPEVPLVSWSADFGGKGATLHIVVQSPADIRIGWGEDALDIISTNCIVVWMGGIKGPKDMQWGSQLFGKYSVTNEQGAAAQEDVLSGADLSSMGEFEVAIRMAGIDGIYGMVPRYFDRADYKAIMKKAQRWKPELITDRQDVPPGLHVIQLDEGNTRVVSS